jgi:predicted O-methyltransferase YrrM
MNFYQMRDEYLNEGLVSLIKYISGDRDAKTLSMIEIGSYTGESTRIFASYFGEVVSIDPFENDYDVNDAACHHADFNDVYNKFLENMQSFDNVTNIRKKSDDAITDLIEKKYDFVYIDGMHTYDQVKKDIINYKDLIKPGGFIGGHDYSGYWLDVIKAVDECLEKPDETFQDTSWVKQL